MEHRIVIFVFAALLSQVKSQLCISPDVALPQVIASSPLITAPQVITTPVVATTIIDNSVSAALANALQLLIVSNIIESKLGASCLPNLLNLNPIETPCYPRVEFTQPIAEYVTATPPCAAPIEVISPFRPVIESYPYLGGCNEVVSANYGFAPNFNPCGLEIVNPCLSNVFLPDVVTPNINCYNIADFSPPSFNPYNGCGFEVISPNPFASICGPEIVSVSPPYNNGCFRAYNELVTPIPYNACGEIITPFNPCRVTDVISPCGPYYNGIPEITPISSCNCGCYGNAAEFVTPCNNNGGITEFIQAFNPGCGIAEVIQPYSTYYGGFPEVISPVYKPGCAGIPELLPANPFGPCRDVVTPCTNFPDVIIPTPYNTGYDFCGPTNFAPNFCGVTEILNPVGSFAPIGAEVLIPPAIPVQLNCNFGYLPSLGPCINFNVEQLPYEAGFC